MLFPSGYQKDEDKNLLNLVEKCYQDGIYANQIYWAQSAIDLRVEAGDQSIYNEIYSYIPNTRRRSFNFNRIRRVKNMISGHQRRDRKSITVIPVENADEHTADQFTKIFMWLNQQEGVLETISDAFEQSLVTGLNLLQVWVDYRSDPINGNIKINNCPYDTFLIDPYFRKQDLSDCNYLWKRTYLSQYECISLLPDKEETIRHLHGGGRPDDGKFQYMPENYKLYTNNLFSYDEFYYRAYRKQKLLVDTKSGETLEWSSENTAMLKQFLNTYPEVDIIESIVPTVKLAIIVQGKVMYNDLIGIDTYPFVPIVTYYTPEINSYELRIQGIVRGLRDAQFLYNRRKVIELDTLESQVNSGFIYKENSLVNPKDVFQSGQGRGIALKQDAQMTDVQQIPSPQIPPTTLELSRILADEIQQISGVSEELLGSAQDDKAGILSMLRQGASLTTLQGLFDRLDYSQKLLGKIILKVIQNNFTPGKVKRIIEQEPSEQFYNKFFGSYDCAIESGLNTTSQRQMALAQGLYLREAGIQIPESFFIDNMSIQNKTEIKEAIEQQKQQEQQAQQQAQQIQLEELKARANLANSRAEADRGLAVERVSRVSENESMAIEREAAAAKDRMSGVLDLVKALKEIETIDINQLQTLVQLTQVLKQQEVQSRMEAKQEEAEDLNKQAVTSALHAEGGLSSQPQTSQGGPVEQQPRIEV